MSDLESSTKSVIPSFCLAPRVIQRINQIRLNVDLLGVTLVRLFLPLVPNQPAHTILSIYNIAAWITILTVDKTRIPEAGTTRIQQRKSWHFGLRWTPLLIIMLLIVTFGFHQRILPLGLSIGTIASVAMGSYLDEMLFRNTLQPRLRQFGLPIWVAIGIQSLLYTFAVWLGRVSLSVVMAFWTLGLINGWMVYRFRSLWATFVLALIWNVLWFA